MQVKNLTLRRDVQTLGKIIKTKSAIKKLMRPSLDQANNGLFFKDQQEYFHDENGKKN